MVLGPRDLRHPRTAETSTRASAASLSLARGARLRGPWNARDSWGGNAPAGLLRLAAGAGWSVWGQLGDEGRAEGRYLSDEA